MKINGGELGGSYPVSDVDYRKVEWGFDKLGGFWEGDDDFFNTMEFSGNQMLYEAVHWVSNGNGFVGFSEIINLPEDPFSMNIRSTLNTISDWFLENQMDLLVSESHAEPIGVDHALFNFKSLEQHMSSLKINAFEGFGEVALPEDPFCMKVRSTLNTISDWFHENQRDFVMESRDVVDQMLFECLDWFHNPTISEQQTLSIDLDDAGEPHDAFELVLPYLKMEDLLALEGVCKSLRDLVRKESFLWRAIEFDDSHLKYRVTDDSLLKLTHRAQGNLQCLNLGGCVGITDNGLMQVIASNPQLTKLSVSGCLRLSTSGMLSTLRNLKSSNRLGVKSLTTGGTLYFTKEQFKELNSLLGADTNTVPKSRKQRLYTSRRSDFLEDDDRVIDLEICPLCKKPSLVFDCPLKDHPCPKSSCRACVVCIERCHDCGSCLMDCEFKPFCFAFSCVDCYKKN